MLGRLRACPDTRELIVVGYVRCRENKLNKRRYTAVFQDVRGVERAGSMVPTRGATAGIHLRGGQRRALCRAGSQAVDLFRTPCLTEPYRIPSTDSGLVQVNGCHPTCSPA